MNNCGSAFLGFADRLARKIKKIIRGSLKILTRSKLGFD